MSAPSYLKKMLVVALLLSDPRFCLKAEEKEAMTRELTAVFDNTSAFAWIHRGKLHSYVVDGGGSRNTFWIYTESASSRQITLTSSISAISSMVSGEVEGPAIKEFVGKYLPELLVAGLSFEQVRLLNEYYLRSYVASLVADGFPAETHGDAASRELLQGVCAAPYCSFDNASWRLVFNVIDHDGGVERWSFSGSLGKFEIRTWSRELLIPRGKIRPLRES